MFKTAARLQKFPLPTPPEVAEAFTVVAFTVDKKSVKVLRSFSSRADAEEFARSCNAVTTIIREDAYLA